jgi:hypothetical protein
MKWMWTLSAAVLDEFSVSDDVYLSATVAFQSDGLCAHRVIGMPFTGGALRAFLGFREAAVKAERAFEKLYVAHISSSPVDDLWLRLVRMESGERAASVFLKGV